jgi:hypothetical protein
LTTLSKPIRSANFDGLPCPCILPDGQTRAELEKGNTMARLWLEDVDFSTTASRIGKVSVSNPATRSIDVWYPRMLGMRRRRPHPQFNLDLSVEVKENTFRLDLLICGPMKVSAEGFRSRSVGDQHVAYLSVHVGDDPVSFNGVRHHAPGATSRVLRGVCSREELEISCFSRYPP